MNKKQRPLNNMAVLFALMIFVFLTLAMISTGAILFSLISWEIVKPESVRLWMILLIFAILSVLAGTIIAACFSDLPLKPLRVLNESLYQLAKGNFDVRLNFRFPKEMRELSDSFNRTAAELGNTEILRSDFVNHFSHEFKTPIISIKGFAELLKDNSLSDEERQEYLNIILEESARLTELSTNVLDLTKLENQQIVTHKHTFDVTEQIRRVIVLLQNKWEKKNIRFDIEMDEVSIVANEDMIQQVWINLFDNAIKFSPENSVIHILLIDNKNTITLSVQDHGVGMNEEQLRHIYSKFWQADQSHNGTGNGLGLCVVKKIIELHNGSILAESVLHEGSTFTVSLPKE
ncbi:MAG: HAMP domain-containing histidine kinase [Erysipelotrichaceae bacterium]|nr:HAMP domain-containing histidine kinase [Erysipelotrichaceae bacterium]